MNAFTPLEGTRVLDLSSNLPGPFLTRILADLGAEVIKVEAPRGEGLRHMPPQIDGMGSTFGGLNAGKDSLAIDLKQSEGVAGAMIGIGHSPFLPYIACRRSACSVFVGTPVDGPARMTLMMTAGVSMMPAIPMASVISASDPSTTITIAIGGAMPVARRFSGVAAMSTSRSINARER